MNSISGSSTAWSNVDSTRAQRGAKLFAKVDADGSGGVDKTELQGLFDKIAKKRGGSALNADDQFAKLDTNGDGSLDADELATGMRSLLPARSSTVQFAQQGGAHHGGRRAEGPPPDGAAAVSGSSAAASTDPLDTDGDGTVSPQERLVGELKTALDKMMGTGGTQQIGSSDLDAFSAKLKSAFDSVIPPSGDATASGPSPTQQSPSERAMQRTGHARFGAEAARMLKHYASITATDSAQPAGAAVNVSA